MLFISFFEIFGYAAHVAEIGILIYIVKLLNDHGDTIVPKPKTTPPPDPIVPTEIGKLSVKIDLLAQQIENLIRHKPD